MSCFTPQQLLETLVKLPSPTAYWVAYSGGCDSLVLLDALSRIQAQLAIPIRAIHIHHGLQKEADTWGAICRQACEQRDIPFVLVKLALQLEKGQSLEASARDARYQAIFEQLNAGDMLLTGHHQDDQAETLLLQLLRGAGVAGLSAMPLIKEVQGRWHVRPLLQTERYALETYARSADFQWIEDPSNQQTSFDRNFLRHEIIPRLRQRWPSMNKTLGRSAAHCATAQALIEDQATKDLAVCQVGKDQLSIQSLMTFDRPHWAIILRQWITVNAYPLPNQCHLIRIIDEVIPAKQDRSPQVCWAGVEVRRFQQRLYLLPSVVCDNEALDQHWHEGDACLFLGQRGSLKKVMNQGIKANHWLNGKITLRQRKGGEKFQKKANGKHLKLKHWFQEQGIPPWERDQLPLTYCNNQLVFVGEVLLADYLKAGSEEGILLCWKRID